MHQLFESGASFLSQMIPFARPMRWRRWGIVIVLLPDSHLATGYRHFVSVATLGSVRAASRQLNVAASAISRQIGLLEAQLGISLFERHTRSLALTEAGVELLRGLQAVNQTHEGTLDLLASLKGITRGRVSIAVVESLSISFLPDLLIAFSRKFPGVQAAITVAGSDMVAELVREREADVGVTFNPSALEGLTVEFERGIPLGGDDGAIPCPGQVEIPYTGAMSGTSSCLACA